MLKKFKTLFFYPVRGIETFIAYWSHYSLTPKPSVMYLELTYRCNCRCQFCERWKIGPKLASKELTTKEVKKLLTEAYEIGVRYLGLTGGEPFLRKDIFEIGKFAKKMGFNVTIASNGTLINKKNIKKVASAFDSVAISMDGITKETHDSLRGVPGVYDLAMNALDLLKKWQVPMTVNMVITKRNFKEIDKYIKFFSKKGIPIQLTPVHDYDKSYLKVKKELKKIDIKIFKEEWRRLSSKYAFFNGYYYKHVPTFLAKPNSLLHSYICFAGSVLFFMNPYGEVFPCEFNRTRMGNVREKPLVVIWKEAKELRREISSPKRSCLCWTHCVVPLNNRLTRVIGLKWGFK